jgi:raffinose/stachyose/melibiose transport system substrate-binding protein
MDRNPSRVAAVVAALSVVAGATGWSGSASASGGEEVELTWWVLTLNDNERVVFEETIDGFEAEHPNITISLEERATDPHKEALRTAVGTPGEPDMYWMWTGLGLGGEFVNAGASADLTEYYQEYGWEDRFLSPSLAGVTQYGGYHGVPFTIRGEAVFYRVDAFEQAGITEVPSTYEELVAAADALAAEGIAPFEFGGTVNWHVMRLLDSLFEQACGAETHDQLKAMEADWSAEPCVTETFTEFQMWTDQYLNDGFMGIDNLQSSQLLYAGRAAMTIEGDWFNSEIEVNDNKDEYGVFPFPTGTGRLYGFTEATYIGEQSEHKDEAALFLDYLTSAEIQEDFIGTFGSQSVNKDVAPATDHPLDEAWIDIFGEADGIYLNGDQSLPLDATTEYWRIQNAVALGEMDPAGAGAEMQRFIDARG